MDVSGMLRMTTFYRVVFLFSATIASAAASRRFGPSRCRNCAALFLNNRTARRLTSTGAFTMAKLDSPAAERNKDPIWKVLESKVVPTLCGDRKVAHILEIAAGAGVHTHHFSKQLLTQGTKFRWYPAVNRNAGPPPAVFSGMVS